MKRSGYIMLECVFYVALSSLIVVVLLGCIVSTTASLNKAAQSNTAFCQIAAADNLLQHDLQAAPRLLRDWQVVSDTALIWQHKETDRGWLFEKNTLFRIHGAYSSAQKKWTKKIQHVVARGIDQVQFKLVHHDRKTGVVQAVRYSCETKTAAYRLDHTVVIQNRKV